MLGMKKFRNILDWIKKVWYYVMNITLQVTAE